MARRNIYSVDNSQMDKENKIRPVLEALMRTHDQKEPDVVRGSGIPQPTLYRILRDITFDLDPENVQKLAAWFNVTNAQIRGEEPLPAPRIAKDLREAYKVSEGLFRVPLLSWHELRTPDAFGPAQTQGRIPVDTTVDVSRNAFALRVVGDSMEPQFPAGCFIIVDPAVEAVSGKYVVVRMVRGEEPVFKQLIVDGPKRLLKPLNARYQILEATPEMELLGVVRSLTMNFD